MNEHSKVVMLKIDSRKARADNFPLEEIELMLKEMKCRSDVILSLSPSSHRLKKSAWEEVTAIMGIYFLKRTPEQVKKKWENLLTKTRRKVRQNLVNTSSWSKLNDMVWKFLLENRETKYLFGPGRFSRAEELSNLLGAPLTTECNLSLNVPTESWTVCSPIQRVLTLDNDQNQQNFIKLTEMSELMEKKEVLQQSKEENLSVSDLEKSDTLSTINNPGYMYPSSLLPQLQQFNPSIQDEILSQWRDEHYLRMQILELEHEVSATRLQILKKKLDKS